MINKNKRITPDEINLKSFEFKGKLNPKVWENNKLKSNIREKLINIAKKFVMSTDIDFIPVDIVIVGSLAGFNWSKYSDIDLHIMVNFKDINDNVELVKNYFDAKKNAWNEKHTNLKIYNYDVELYVQDVNEENASNGIYSIKYNHWIKVPKMAHKELQDEIIKETAATYINKIIYYNEKFYELTTDRQFIILNQKVNYLYDLIRNGRKESLAEEGEQAAGNIVFKILRRSGHFGMLKNLKDMIYDRINSIGENFKVSDDKLTV